MAIGLRGYPSGSGSLTMSSAQIPLARRSNRTGIVAFRDAMKQHVVRCSAAPWGKLRQAARKEFAVTRATGGTAAVEFALAAPLLLGPLVPAADLGIAFSQNIEVQQAAQA